MNCCTANLDGDNRVEYTYGYLERLKVLVLVREHPKVVVVDPKADTRMYVLLRWFKPRIPLSLQHKVV